MTSQFRCHWYWQCTR